MTSNLEEGIEISLGEQTPPPPPKKTVSLEPAVTPPPRPPNESPLLRTSSISTQQSLKSSLRTGKFSPKGPSNRKHVSVSMPPSGSSTGKQSSDETSDESNDNQHVSFPGTATNGQSPLYEHDDSDDDSDDWDNDSDDWDNDEDDPLISKLVSQVRCLGNKQRKLQKLVPEIEKLKEQSERMSWKLDIGDTSSFRFDGLESDELREQLAAYVLDKVDNHINLKHSAGSNKQKNSEMKWQKFADRPAEFEQNFIQRGQMQRRSTIKRLKTKQELKEIRLEQDAYSFLICYKWNSSPFILAIFVIFGLQLFLVSLLVQNQVDFWDSENPVNIPANIDWSVRTAQVLSLFIAVFSQDDMRTGIEGIIQGIPVRFKGTRDFYAINSAKWNFSYFVRFVVGTMTLGGTVILIVQSDNVFDLFLNFSGIEFISHLDDLVFSLALRGYTGHTIEKAAQKIVEGRFDLAGKKKYKRCLTRKKRSIVMLIVIALLVFGTYTYFVVSQVNGVYLEDIIQVEFGDAAVPYLGAFNGCYGREPDSFNSRVSYVQTENTQFGGAFGFCISDDNEFTGWTFFVGDDPCNDMVIKSGDTNSYDLLDVGSSDWYTADGQPLDFVRLLKLEGNGECGLAPSTPKQCSSLTVDSGLEGFSDKIQLWNFDYDVLVKEDGNEVKFFEHPVFVGEYEHVGEAGLEVLFFAGRRWLLAETTHLGLLGDPKNETELIALFESEEFNILELNQGDFVFISEAVDIVSNEGLPLGLQWYNTRYVDSSTIPFPFADISRPVDALFRCGECNDSRFSCLFEGVCNEGICTCQHSTSGKLCGDTPLGDGVCQEFFNQFEYNYDEGDCCGGTCQGSFCGFTGEATPFGFNLDDPDIASVQGGYLGYPTCHNPDMVALTIKLTRDGTPDSFCDLDSINVECDKKTYLQTPFLSFGDKFDDSNNCAQSYNDTIYVPFGSHCMLTRESLTSETSDYSTEIFYETVDIPFREAPATENSLNFFLPPECLSRYFKTLSEDFIVQTKSARSQVIHLLSEDSISEAMCQLDTGYINERYALSLFNISVAIKSTEWDPHQCYGWGSPAVTIVCNEGFVQTLYLDEASTGKKGPLIPELTYLSRMESLRLNSPDITGTIPTEFGQFDMLTEMYLNKNNLEGNIPTELGNLTKLELLSLRDNKMTGEIPTEIFKLTNLKSLSLGGNNFVGTLATEIGYLTNLEVLLIQDNAFTGNLPEQMSLLTNLKSCYLGGNGFSPPLQNNVCRM